MKWQEHPSIVLSPPNSLVEFDHLTSTRRDSSLGAMILLCPKETVFGLVLVEYIF